MFPSFIHFCMYDRAHDQDGHGQAQNLGCWAWWEDIELCLHQGWEINLWGSADLGGVPCLTTPFSQAVSRTSVHGRRVMNGA